MNGKSLVERVSLKLCCKSRERATQNALPSVAAQQRLYRRYTYCSVSYLRGRRGGERLHGHAPEFEESGGSRETWWELGAGDRSTNGSRENQQLPGGAFEYTSAVQTFSRQTAFGRRGRRIVRNIHERDFEGYRESR